MSKALRAISLLLLTLWVGGVLFFPVVAATAFGTLPDTHAAGTVVGKCLRILHYEGLFAGSVLVILLVALSTRTRLRGSRIAAVLVALMLGLTAYSQFGIIPKMEADRLQAGGAIRTSLPSSPEVRDFNRLHHRSEQVEETVLVLGVITVLLIS